MIIVIWQASYERVNWRTITINEQFTIESNETISACSSDLQLTYDESNLFRGIDLIKGDKFPQEILMTVLLMRGKTL
jgi:hypothetical protein